MPSQFLAPSSLLRTGGEAGDLPTPHLPSEARASRLRRRKGFRISENHDVSFEVLVKPNAGDMPLTHPPARAQESPKIARNVKPITIWPAGAERSHVSQNINHIVTHLYKFRHLRFPIMAVCARIRLGKQGKPLIFQHTRQHILFTQWQKACPEVYRWNTGQYGCFDKEISCRH
jgi:hypothetical protein